MVKSLVRLYEETVHENINYLKKLERELYGKAELHKRVHETLFKSSQTITKKWLAGKKYLRTKYARDAILEYPKDVLKLSLILDATINLMDDLLDETLSREERAFYLVELLRVLALRDNYPIEDEVKTRISNYFNKIIFVAISEQIFLEKMKDKEGEDFYKVAYDYFAGRSLDMDLFLEIPLHELKYKKNEIDEIVRVGRIFRTINLMKKDLIDLEHDIEFDIPTPIVMLHQKEKPFNDFIEYVFSRALGDVPQRSSKKAEPIIYNLVNLTIKEQKEIVQLLRKERESQRS